MFLTSFTIQNFLQLIFYLIVLVGVLFVTYYVTRWYANGQKTQLSNNNFKVIETLKVTNNKYIQIVKIGKEDYYIVAIGKDEIHYLGKLDESQIVFPNNSKAGGGFQNILTSFKNSFTTQKDDEKDTVDSDED